MEHLVSFGFLALPTVFITLGIIAAVLALVRPRRRRLWLALTLLANLCLYAAATPALSSFLLRRAETPAAAGADVDLQSAQAIVVLGADVVAGNGADIPDRLGPMSLERVFLAAAAYRRLHIPVAVSGGTGDNAHQSQAALMRAALEGNFGVPVNWVEGRSRTTWENAVDTARLLRPAGVDTVVLVTSAWHLPRSVWCFEQAGLRALSWPAPRDPLHATRLGDFVPDLHALDGSFNALHELIGRIYYRLRY
jgi:uncharacterized SAM-binding protein YcdF (DUF218 family)